MAGQRCASAAAGEGLLFLPRCAQGTPSSSKPLPTPPQLLCPPPVSILPAACAQSAPSRWPAFTTPTPPPFASARAPAAPYQTFTTLLSPLLRHPPRVLPQLKIEFLLRGFSVSGHYVVPCTSILHLDRQRKITKAWDFLNVLDLPPGSPSDDAGSHPPPPPPPRPPPPRPRIEELFGLFGGGP